MKWLFLSSYSHLDTQSTPSRSGLTPLTLLSHYFLSFTLRYLENMMVPETNDHLPTLVTSQQSGVASTASRTRSVLDPPEEDATTYSHKRARHTGGEPTSLDERADVLGRYRASYRLNRHGSGVFTLNIRDDNNSVHKVCFNTTRGPTSYCSKPRPPVLGGR